MSDNIEQTIAQLAKERAKTILENSDFWSGPGASKTSAEAVTALVALAPPVTIAKANAASDAVLMETMGFPPAPAPSKRTPKPKEQPQSPDANGESDPD